MWRWSFPSRTKWCLFPLLGVGTNFPSNSMYRTSFSVSSACPEIQDSLQRIDHRGDASGYRTVVLTVKDIRDQVAIFLVLFRFCVIEMRKPGW
mmetsp:Transcript_9899/g.24674  ORF Transcript_9899/g.24674 Transcript_9899/m.24674 type:complete len:93 (-) Transcript_9899:23-301(-)